MVGSGPRHDIAASGGRWQPRVAGGWSEQRSKGDREDAAGYASGRGGTASRHSCIHSQVTGDGHRGIGHSGVGFSAIGHRLRIPAAQSRNEFPTANR